MYNLLHYFGGYSINSGYLGYKYFGMWDNLYDRSLPGGCKNNTCQLKILTFSL